MYLLRTAYPLTPQRCKVYLLRTAHPPPLQFTSKEPFVDNNLELTAICTVECVRHVSGKKNKKKQYLHSTHYTAAEKEWGRRGISTEKIRNNGNM